MIINYLGGLCPKILQLNPSNLTLASKKLMINTPIAVLLPPHQCNIFGLQS